MATKYIGKLTYRLRLGIQGMEDWYTVRKDQIRKAGGGGLLYYFGDSLQTVLKHGYPSSWINNPPFRHTEAIVALSRSQLGAVEVCHCPKWNLANQPN